MPTFPKATPTQLAGFTLTFTIFENPPGTANLTLSFAVTLLDAGGQVLARPSGDLVPYLTPQQVTNFTNAALALYAKAKAELLT